MDGLPSTARGSEAQLDAIMPGVLSEELGACLQEIHSRSQNTPPAGGFTSHHNCNGLAPVSYVCFMAYRVIKEREGQVQKSRLQGLLHYEIL